MCGRYTLATSPAPILSQLELPFDEEHFTPRFNIAPTQEILGVAAAPLSAPKPAFLRWGLIPHWADDPAKVRGGLINARGETVGEKASFRTPFRRRRCLILADGFYEWKETERGKQPYRIVRHDREPFPMAGIWDHWQGPDGLTLNTCAIITIQASPGLAHIHPRMPVILQKKDMEAWLDVDGFHASQAQRLLQPFPDEELRAYPVSTRVNRAANDVPEVIEPLEIG